MSELMKSKILMAEDAGKIETPAHMPGKSVLEIPEILDILPIECLNEFIAVLQFQQKVHSEIIIPEQTDLGLPFGAVVGVGAGINWQGSKLSLGDLVKFQERSILTTLDLEFYQGHKIIILSERNILCRITNLKHVIIKDTHNLV